MVVVDQSLELLDIETSLQRDAHQVLMKKINFYEKFHKNNNLKLKFYIINYMPGCPSWSKGSDLRSAVFVLVGSNPTSGIYLIIQ